MQTVNKKQRIESLYILKAICAYFVVYIHMNGNHPLLMPILGIGTPCFLSITGYLLYSADHERERMKCIKWAKKTFWLAVSCNLLYILAYYANGEDKLFTSLSFHVQNFFFGNQVSGHLWYLSALWQALLVMFLIIRYVPRTINVLPVLFLVAYLLRVYWEPFHPGTGALRNNFLVTSLPFLATGYLVHKYEELFLKKFNVLVCLLVTLLVAYAEFFLRKHFGLRYSYFLLTSYPLVVFLMFACVRYKNFTLPVLGKIGQFHSPNVYYFHILFMGMINVFFSPLWPNELFALVVYLVCLPFSVCFNFAANSLNKFILPYLKKITFRQQSSELN